MASIQLVSSLIERYNAGNIKTCQGN